MAGVALQAVSGMHAIENACHGCLGGAQAACVIDRGQNTFCRHKTANGSPWARLPTRRARHGFVVAVSWVPLFDRRSVTGSKMHRTSMAVHGLLLRESFFLRLGPFSGESYAVAYHLRYDSPLRASVSWELW
jgi:hypothetical protein